MAAEPLPEGLPQSDSGFAGAEELRKLPEPGMADVVDIKAAPSAQREELTREVTERRRREAAERWVENSVKDYGDLRFKRQEK